MIRVPLSVLSIAALVTLTACPREDSASASKDPATPSSAGKPTQASANEAAAKKAPTRRRFGDIRPQPKRVHLSSLPMGKGEASYEIDLDVERWTIAGTREAGSDTQTLSATPLPSDERKKVQASVKSMQLVTESSARCQEIQDDPAIHCGDFHAVTFGSERYSTADKSCQYVDGDVYEVVERAFDTVVAARATPP